MRIKTQIHSSIFLIALCLYGFNLQAETVEFPDEELATETVVPVFEKNRSVLNRNVQTEKRVEFGGGMGMALNEPFYNPLNFSGNLTYHVTDQHAVNLAATFFMSGLTEYGEQLKNGEGLDPGKEFDPSKAPAPKWMALGNYQFTAYYGKISFSRQTVMNLTLFGLAGIGVVQTGGTSNVALNLGFGQNFYFTPRLAARFDLKLLMYNGPDATSKDLDTSNPTPADDAFGKDLIFRTYLSLGLVYLL